MTLASVHAFWVISRAAGITASALAGLSVCAGLLVSGNGRAKRLLEARSLHEILSLCTLAMVALHGFVLLGDPWLSPGLSGIAIPFASDYRPLWTGMGVFAGYGLIALGLSYYARGRIGTNRWRGVHRLVALFWLLAIAHALGAGTDAGQLWFLLILAVTSGPALILLVIRHASRIRMPQPPPGTRGEAVQEDSNPALSGG